ncbi:MAG: adenosine kinase [Gammaproteobacteria bacterium]
MSDSVQLLGVSNAIVDVLATVSHEFIEELGCVPGSMNLIDADQATAIYESMGPATERSGGSVANTVAAFANLGGRAAYIGRVNDDQLGEVFAHDMKALGVDMRLPPRAAEAATARCYVMVTPDGQRTMHTYLGACLELHTDDITEGSVGVPQVVFFEGYLLDAPHGPALIDKAIEIAKDHGSEVALSLSDSFCVERHRDRYLELVNNSVDIVIADDSEVKMLFGTDDLASALDAAADFGNLFAVTKAAEGSVIVRGSERIEISADPVEKVIDSTGAGDAYAAGFLYGYAQDKPLRSCGRLGSWCGAQAVQQLGARFESENLTHKDLS